MERKNLCPGKTESLQVSESGSYGLEAGVRDQDTARESERSEIGGGGEREERGVVEVAAGLEVEGEEGGKVRQQLGQSWGWEESEYGYSREVHLTMLLPRKIAGKIKEFVKKIVREKGSCRFSGYSY